jgi:catechol 2,3-dioxygenase-like lactoylglutathione lyase family enzyme
MPSGMSNVRPGTAYWIDHYTIPTNDLQTAIAFHERVLGVKNMPGSGLPPFRGMFQAFAHPELKLRGPGHCHQGLFITPATLPPAEKPGTAYPRYALYVRQADVDAHLRRLDAAGVEHSGPIRSSEFGEDGTAIYWNDADGNQFEFWAARNPPAGAFDDVGEFGVGRASHAVYASRDLDRTAAFFERFCNLEALKSGDVPADTLVLPLAAGGRLVFKHTADTSPRASGNGTYLDMHCALVVHEEDFWPIHERMWAELPEWPYNAETKQFEGDARAMPARTLIHMSPNGMRFHAAFGRGDDWLDPDQNLFHFVGGAPQNGSMATYDRYFLDDYMDEFLARHGKVAAR